ncbi:MAG: SIR2 family NAD-dependent protein deacylase [Candidatus Kariarchaeaceae archaeon]|jgi:NAD-dependent SIR2 family protein deacetylase
MMDDLIDQAAKYIAQSKSLVIFTGAGISTPSGLPDYRGPDGVWTRRDKGLKPKPIGKPWHEFEPNAAHDAIVKLQDLGILKYVIAQNVDGLHLKSGIKPELIAELHGNSTLMKCTICDLRFTKPELDWDDAKFGKGYRSHTPVSNQPKCPECQGRIISSIVNFGDPMPEKEIRASHLYSEQSDVFVVIGSSLSVVPASSFLKIAKDCGAIAIIINQGETVMDDLADLRINGDCALIFPRIVELVIELKNLKN